MDARTQNLLENLFVAQVLTLAQTIKIQKQAKGQSSTGDYTFEAAQMITQKRSSVLQLLGQNSL